MNTHQARPLAVASSITGNGVHPWCDWVYFPKRTWSNNRYKQMFPESLIGIFFWFKLPWLDYEHGKMTFYWKGIKRGRRFVGIAKIESSPNHSALCYECMIFFFGNGTAFMWVSWMMLRVLLQQNPNGRSSRWKGEKLIIVPTFFYSSARVFFCHVYNFILICRKLPLGGDGSLPLTASMPTGLH